MSGQYEFRHNPNTNFDAVDSLTKKQAQREAEVLREGIHYHDRLYYVENEPEISDAIYDKLFQRLQQLEETFPGLASEDSPTRRVGSEPVDELMRVDHTAPMLSLQAVFDREKVQAFMVDLRFFREPRTHENIEAVRTWQEAAQDDRT